MDIKILYAIRGWIVFVAFMDFGTAVRSYIEKRSFLSKTIHNVDNFVDEEYTTSRVLGMYSILKALVLVHCSLYIHYKPLLSMGIWSVVITLMLYFTETIYFRAASLNFYVVFPFILNVLTLGCLIYVQKTVRMWDSTLSGEEENEQLLNASVTSRKRRHCRKY
ncbi:uncharacterized protein LOC108916493 [Anoplophora glabripennis]|uniref:uncharacterized protein LOC108916493 n=1 Tax=Anoplophora glabripennis TaxID=217634 RepID=UPI000874CA20|nr:uncharacterized protein LOC108916493 [Anoplophora glabripennis]